MNSSVLKFFIAAVFAFAFSAVIAEARLINAQTFRELEKMSDTIVVAKPVANRDTEERTDLRGIAPGIQVIGLSSEFEVSMVVKGDANLKSVVVHHYRLADPNQRMMNAPMLASFDPKSTNRYLVFLHREADGRYAPFEQVDPAWTSFMEVSGPGWETMGAEDFKHWLNVRRWRAEPGPCGKTLSPELWPAEWGESEVFEATVNGDVEKLQRLLFANPGLVDERAKYGQQTPLHAAAEMGQKPVADLLLKYKADIEAKANGGWTPLLNAVFGGHKDMVELLLMHLADVNFHEDAGRSPLHIAAENGFTEIAALLLTNKAEVDPRNRERMTPLHVAAANGYKDMVELLLNYKAEINAKDAGGRTPLVFAEIHKNLEMAELLKEHGGTK